MQDCETIWRECAKRDAEAERKAKAKKREAQEWAAHARYVTARRNAPTGFFS